MHTLEGLIYRLFQGLDGDPGPAGLPGQKGAAVSMTTVEVTI